MDSDYQVLAPPATPPPRLPKRSNQPVGVHFESPKRQRLWRRDSDFVIRPGLARQEQELTARLNSLLEQVKGCATLNVHPDCITRDTATPVQDPQLAFDDAGGEEYPDAQPSTPEHEPHARRLLPNEATHKLYNQWLLLIPQMLPEYLGFMQGTLGRLGRSPHAQSCNFCSSGICATRSCTSVQCLHFDCL